MARNIDPTKAASPRVRLGVGAVLIVVFLALAATVAIALLRGLGAPSESIPLERGGDEHSVEGAGAGEHLVSGELYVHVFGAAKMPGLYRLGDGARVVDAVAAAGGFREDAEPGAVNLARLLSDGEQLYLPTHDEAQNASAPAGAGGGGGGASDGRINLNTAGVAELDGLPRIGPSMAARIVAWRDSNGRFTSIDDLLAVPGIGEKTLESLRTLVTV